jgi:hypothetical protein
MDLFGVPGLDIIHHPGGRVRMQNQNRIRFLNSMARVWINTANTAIATATVTAVNFATESFDTDGIHDNVTNNSRLTCQLTGKYLVVVAAQFEFNATGDRAAYIYKNGAIYSLVVDIGATNTQTAMVSGVDFLSLTAGDYIEMRVFQDSGGNLNLLGATEANTHFAMYYIGE